MTDDSDPRGNMAGAAVGRAEVTANMSVVMRTYLSGHHLWNARYQAGMASKIEAAHHGRPHFDVRLRGHVLSAVLSAVAFLEAAINELYRDVVDNHPGSVDALPASAKANLKILNVRGRTMDRFQAALVCCGQPAFDVSALPFQPVLLLVKLRNELVHPHPQTVGLERTHTLAKQLEGKFEQSRLMKDSREAWSPGNPPQDSGNALYPDKLLGAGCANWAVDVAVALADEFFKRVGIMPNYQAAKFDPPDLG